MPSLAQEIDRYIAYFKGIDAARSAQTSSPIEWQSPIEAINPVFDKPAWSDGERKSPGWGNLDRKTFQPYIEEWLRQNRITGLSFVARGYDGWTAEIFKARIEGVRAPQYFGIGTEAGKMPHLNTPWSPLLLQPFALGILTHRQDGKKYQLALTRMPDVAPMIDPGQPPGYGEFLNTHVLPGTPWRMHRHIDLNVLPGGVPIYSGADSLVFVDMEAWRRHLHKDNQWKAKYQRETMAVLHANYERIGLPQCLRCVQLSPETGNFVTSQSRLLPDPLGGEGNARSSIQVGDRHRPPEQRPQARRPGSSGSSGRARPRAPQR